MKSLAKVVSFILILIAALTILHFAIVLIFDQDPGFLRHSGVGHVTFYLLFILNVFLFQKFVNKQSISSLGFRRYPGWWITVLKGWGVGVIAFVSYTLLMEAFGVIELRMKYDMGRILLALLIGLTAFGIAATEEALFRGFFLQTMLKDLPTWVAVLISGIIFVNKLSREKLISFHRFQENRVSLPQVQFQ